MQVVFFVVIADDGEFGLVVYIQTFILFVGTESAVMYCTKEVSKLVK